MHIYNIKIMGIVHIKNIVNDIMHIRNVNSDIVHIRTINNGYSTS